MWRVDLKNLRSPTEGVAQFLWLALFDKGPRAGRDGARTHLWQSVNGQNDDHALRMLMDAATCCGDPITAGHLHIHDD